MTLLAVEEGALLDWLIRATWQSACLALVILVLHKLFARQIAPRWRYAMWLLVIGRLALPVQIGIPWSPFPAPTERQPDIRSAENSSAGPFLIRTGVDGPVVPLIQNSSIEPLPQPSLPAAAQAIDWRRLVISVWLAIAAAMICLFVCRYLYFGWLIHREPRKALPEPIEAVLGECAARWHMRCPRVVVTRRVKGPAVFGLVKPAILLPTGMVQDLSPQAARFIFLHEMAHLKRRDAWTDALAVLVCACHWFNPFAWFTLRRLRAERELACDQAVLRQTPETSHPAYGHLLLAVATHTNRLPPLSVVSMATQGTLLKGRITMIAHYQNRPLRNRLAAISMMLLAIAMLVRTQTQAAEPVPTKVTPASEAKPAAPLAGPLTGAAEKETKEEETRRLLDQRLPMVRFDAVGLADVIDFLRDTAKVDVFVNWTALEAAGVDRNRPITMNMRNVSAGKILSFVLEAAGGNRTMLKYELDEGVVVISTAEGLTEKGVTRTYDIRDLLIIIPDFKPEDDVNREERRLGAERVARLRHELFQQQSDLESLRKTRGEQHTTVKEAAARAEQLAADLKAAETRQKELDKANAGGLNRAELLEQLQSLITETIAVGTWKDQGGVLGMIREVGGQLIVTQSVEAHNQINALLKLLRQQRGLQVSVEARFLILDPEKLPEGALKGRMGDGNAGEKTLTQMNYLTQEEAAMLLLEIQRDKTAIHVGSPRLSLFNGQRAYVQAYSPKAYIAGMRQIGDGQKPTWEPVMATVEPGVRLDLTATISADRKAITMTVHPKMTSLLRMEVVPFTPPVGEAPAGLTVQSPVVATQELQTSFSVPSGQTVLLGGMISPAEQKADRKMVLVLIRGAVLVPDSVVPNTVIEATQPASQP